MSIILPNLNHSFVTVPVPVPDSGFRFRFRISDFWVFHTPLCKPPKEVIHLHTGYCSHLNKVILYLFLVWGSRNVVLLCSKWNSKKY